MTDHQKWIVYPLLFFCVAVTVKDRMFRGSMVETDRVVCRELRGAAVETDRIVCRELHVVDEKGKIKGFLAVSNESGVMELIGAQGRPIVVVGSHREHRYGDMQLFDIEGRPVVKQFTLIPNPRVQQAPPKGADPNAPAKKEEQNPPPNAEQEDKKE